MTLSEFKIWLDSFVSFIELYIVEEARNGDWDTNLFPYILKIQEQLKAVTSNDQQPLPFVKTPLFNAPNVSDPVKYNHLGDPINPSFTEEEINKYKSNINKLLSFNASDPVKYNYLGKPVIT